MIQLTTASGALLIPDAARIVLADGVGEEGSDILVDIGEEDTAIYRVTETVYEIRAMIEAEERQA